MDHSPNRRRHCAFANAIHLAALAMVLSSAGAARGQLALEWDFDHGSLDPAGTTVTDSLVTLKPRTDIYINRWVHVRADGAQGLAPEFRISNSHVAANTLSSAHRYVYSYDRLTWQFFDEGLNDGSYYRFWNNAPFTGETVWLAYGLPYSWEMTEDHLDEVVLSPWVTPTPTADAEYIVGYSNDGLLSDAGRIVPQLPLYGYRITDSSAGGDKAVVVLTTGNHPNETTGTYTFHGMMDFLIGDDPRAAALRRAADFYVYPNCNPDGRWAGHARSNPENPNIDHNRDWDDPVLFTDIAVLTAAMQADTAGYADYFLDFHSFNNTSDIAVWLYAEDVGIPFVQALTALEPNMQLLIGDSPPDSPGVARHWAHSASGLGAPHTFTPESGFIPGWLPSRYMLQGERYALALYEALVVDSCTDAGTTGFVAYADDFDAGTSGLRWSLLSRSSDYTAEFAYDYSTRGIPPAPGGDGHTTTGLRFTVNNNDTDPTTEAVSAYPDDLWLDGDHRLSFDMWLNYNGPAGGGTGSTEFMTAGLGAGGDRVNWPGNPASDGYTFAVSGEGGAGQDYVAYAGATPYGVTSGAYPAGSQNSSASYYQALFPAPPYETAGAPGKHWVKVDIISRDGAITWRINGVTVAEIAAAPSPGTVMLGYMDVFTSLAQPADDNFVVYDNVRVTRLEELDCNSNGLPDACEAIAPGDFDGDGDVGLADLAAFADCLGGPAADPARITCASLCRAAFDQDEDEDIDLFDYAAFTQVYDLNP